MLGIDADAGQIRNAKANANERLILVNDSYASVKGIVERLGFGPVNGMLLDLGYSSWHMEDSEKGFSFQKDEALDMRYGSGELTAARIVNEWSEKELERILEEYGEEKFAKKIAAGIVEQRRVKKIETTFDLVRIVEEVVPGKFQHGKIHCATKTFQALRIAVNDELGSLEKVLPSAIDVLAQGGRLAVISFHSLEDRIVKNFFKSEAEKGLINIVTKKPVVAGAQEVRENPRARSAKLRVIIKN